MSSPSSNNGDNDAWLMKIELKREEPGEINKDDGIKKARVDQAPAVEEGDIITWVWALPVATAKLGGGAPVSYHHHTPIFTIFLSSILLVIF